MRKMMILLMFSLIMSSALLVSPLPVFAEEDTGLNKVEVKPALTRARARRVQAETDLRSNSFSQSSFELSDLDEGDIDEVINEVDAGDHIIFIGKVVNSDLKEIGKRLFQGIKKDFTTTKD